MAQGSATDLWGATLAAALIGAERIPARIPEAAPLDLPATGDAGGDLLARVGALGVHRLAGTGLSADALAPFELLESTGQPCPPAAARRLGALIASGGARERIAEWCDLAADRGMRAPPECLAALDLAAGSDAEADRIDRIAGTELAWLRRVWTGDAAHPSAAPDDWSEGDAKTRLAAFGAFRRRDPGGAREALEAVFTSEKADMRAGLVSVLRDGLGPGDEPFLDGCLDDRAGGVREAAQALLPCLPQSRFAQRMTRRAQTALQVKETRRLLRGAQQELVVTLPEEAPDLVRDGVAPTPYGQRAGGPRAQLLQQVVAAAPLSAHAGYPPRLWVECALRSEWQEQLLAGFAIALGRERIGAWTEPAIAVLHEACAGRLSGIKPSDAARRGLAYTVGTLSAADWERTVASGFKGPLDVALTMMEHIPKGLSPGFSAILLDWLSAAIAGSASGREALGRSGLCRRIAERLDANRDSAARAANLSAPLPEEGEAYLRQQIAALAETLDLRAAMRREFDPT